MSESNKQTVRKIQEAWSSGRLDELDQFFAPEFDNKQSALPGLPAGLAGAKIAYQATITAFPDRKVEIIDMVAEADTVYMRTRTRGTNTGGAAWVHAPEGDGKTFDVEQWSMYRFKDGKVVEHAGISDRYGLALQLGGIKPPARA